MTRPAVGPSRLTADWIVSFPLVIKKCHEAVILSPGQLTEVRVVADPLRRALHLAFRIADRELQAGDHFLDQGIRLGFRIRVGREGRVGASQVIRGWPGRSAVLPGPATGAQSRGDRLLLRRPGWEAGQHLGEVPAVSGDGRRYPGDRAGVAQFANVLGGTAPTLEQVSRRAIRHMSRIASEPNTAEATR